MLTQEYTQPVRPRDASAVGSEREDLANYLSELTRRANELTDYFREIKVSDPDDITKPIFTTGQDAEVKRPQTIENIPLSTDQLIKLYELHRLVHEIYQLMNEKINVTEFNTLSVLALYQEHKVRPVPKQVLEELARRGLEEDTPDYIDVITFAKITLTVVDE